MALLAQLGWETLNGYDELALPDRSSTRRGFALLEGAAAGTLG